MTEDLQRQDDETAAPAVVIQEPGGTRIELSLNEYRLALLGLVDFTGRWDDLEAATRFVVDGPGKAKLVSERLRPLAEHLPSLLNRGVDALEVLAARFWFRQETL